MNTNEFALNVVCSFVLAGVAGALWGEKEFWTILLVCLGIDLICFIAK